MKIFHPFYWPGELGTPTDWPKYGGVNGASWSKFIGEKVDGLPDLMQCKGLCFFRECHYLVHHGSTCYLGDFGVTASVIDTQAESRDAYIYDGKMIRTSGGLINLNFINSLKLGILLSLKNLSSSIRKVR